MINITVEVVVCLLGAQQSLQMLPVLLYKLRTKTCDSLVHLELLYALPLIATHRVSDAFLMVLDVWSQFEG